MQAARSRGCTRATSPPLPKRRQPASTCRAFAREAAAILVLHIIGGLLLVLAAAGAAYATGAAWLALRLARPKIPQAATTIPLTILKPLCGAEPGLAENLISFARQ